MFKHKRILVTGGTGSWGYELIRQLLPMEPEEIIIFSRNETAQVTMNLTFNDSKLTFRIGDVRDKDALLAACRQVDIVFHLAALKHVPVCEEQPYEALKTNVIGTQHVIEAAIANQVSKVIYISTDKAASPSNFYGMTKAIGEKLIVYANLLRSNTQFVCVRGGNVLGTNGSVVHLFKEQIKKRQAIGITDKRMTRFFLTLHEAIHLLFKAAEYSYGGEIYVMTMPTCRIIDLAEVLIENEPLEHHAMLTIEEKGIRPGEKLHEILMSEYESMSTVVYTAEYLIILPTIHIPGLKEKYSQCPPVQFTSFSSEWNTMNKVDIRAMLERGGFLA